MASPNIANFTTFNSLLVNNIEIQSNGVGLKIYSSDPNNPEYSFNPQTREFNVAGNLIVTGEASFETITISELDGGLFSLAGNNVANLIDIGIYGKYNDGAEKYTGVIRSAASDRWVFFRDVTGPIGTTITLNSNFYSDVVAKKLFLNNGTASGPAVTFNASGTSGLYLESSTVMGLTVAEKYITRLVRTSGTVSSFELNTDTTLKFVEVSTLDDSTRTAGATTGHLYIQSTSGADRWMKFYTSASNFAGSVYTSPSRHFFITNTGTNLDIYHLTHSDTVSQSPDYRSGSKSLIFTASSTNIESKLAHIFPAGTVSLPSVTFIGQTSTGIYNSGTTILFSSFGSNKFNIATDNVNTTQQFRVIDGSVSIPSVSFTNDIDIGFYRDTSLLSGNNISFTINSAVAARFIRNSAVNQLLMPNTGTVALPSYSFEGDENTGIYPIGGDDIGISTNGVIRSRYNNTYIENYRTTYFTPNATDRRVIIRDSTTLVSNDLRANLAKFNSYNFVDESILLFYSPTGPTSLTTDMSGNGNNATNIGTVAYKETEVSGPRYARHLYDFTTNSNNKYLQLTQSLFNSIGNVTISFWVKTATSVSTQTVFSCMQNGNNNGVLIEILPSGYLQVSVGNTAVVGETSGTLKFTYQSSLSTNGWHHVVLILGNSSQFNNLYINNVDATVNYISSGNGGSPGTSSITFSNVGTFAYTSIGVFKNSGSQSNGFTGYLEDFYITQRALTSTEVSTIYNGSNAYFDYTDMVTINSSYIKTTDCEADYCYANEKFISYNDGSNTNPAYTFNNDNTTGIYLQPFNRLGITAAGTHTVSFAENQTIFEHTIIANAGLEIIDGQLLSVGTSGSTSSLYVYGNSTTHSLDVVKSDNTTYLFSVGDDNVICNKPLRVGDVAMTYATDGLGFDGALIHQVTNTINGSDGTISDFQAVQFQTLTLTAATSATYTNASTLRIRGPPWEGANTTITNAYAFRVDGGRTYIDGEIQLLPNDAINGYVLTSDANGVATWQASGSFVTFGNGLEASPSIAFASDSNTGFYRIGEDQIGISTGGSNRVSISTTAVTLTNNMILNVGSSGTSSPLNVYGLITGNNGLTISAGTSALQATTCTTLTSSSLLTANAGITINNSALTISGTSTILLQNGTLGAPSIAFSSDTDTGLYYTASSVLNVSNNNQQTFSFNNRSLGNHISYNLLEVRPNGTNTRLLIEDTKLRASSNQTILNITPILYFKFSSDPATNTNTQDSSINKYAILGTNTPTFVNNDLLLTAANGEGLLEFGAVQLASATRVETNENITSLTYLTEFIIAIKFKLIAFDTTRRLFEVYADRDGSPTTKFIRLTLSGTTELNLTVHNGTSNNINLTTNNANLAIDVWYSLVLTFTSSGHSIKLNGGNALTYAGGGTGTSSTTLNINTDWATLVNPTVIVGGVATSASTYVDEFYIAPTTTSEIINLIYRTQAHEVYTNKLQLGLSSGIIDEGYLLRSDKGNNAVWDNSVQIKAGYIELTNSKVLRIPAGSITSPAYSFSSDTNTGIYSIGADQIGISTGGTNRVSISTTAFTITTGQTLNVGSSGNTSPLNVYGDVFFNAGFRKKVLSTSSTSLTLDSTHYLVEFSSTSAVSVTLPAASSHSGREYVLVKTGASGTITISRSSPDTIDDAATTSISLTTQYDKVSLISNGVDRWYTV